MLDRILANVRIVEFTLLARRSIDHQLNLPVFDRIDYVGPPFIDLVYDFTFNPGPQTI